MGQWTELDYVAKNKNNIHQQKVINNCDSSDGDELEHGSEDENTTTTEILSNLKERIYSNLSSIATEFQTTEYEQITGLLETFAFHQICYAFAIDLKWKPTLHSKFTINGFIDELDLSRNMKKLILTLLRRLAQHGILIELVEGWEFEVMCLLPTEEIILNDLENCEMELHKFPNLEQEVLCTDYFGSHLLSVLSGKESGLKILFPYEKDSLRYPYAAKSLYENSYTMKQTKVLPTITGVNEHIKYLRNNRIGPIRILEIGAGTGGTTIPLLKSLPWEIFENNLLEYVFTDISNFFVGQTKANIQSQFYEEVMNCIEFTTLDIENDPKTQGFVLESYDMIIAADVFHATEYIQDTLGHTKSLLKPGGLLVLGEVFQSTMVIEISFGMTSGWWRFSDQERTHFSSPLLRPTEWNQLLKNNGFLDSFSIGDNSYGIVFAQAK